MLIGELLGEAISMAGKSLVMVRHKSKLYNVEFLEEEINGNLVLVIQDTSDVTEEEEETINPDLDDNQSQDEEDTPDEESEDTNVEEILEELEGSTFPDIYSSRDHKSAITKTQATEYRINPQEAA